MNAELEVEASTLRQTLEDQKRQTAEVKTAAFELERRLRAQNNELETKLQEQSTLLDEKRKEVVTFEIELFSLRQTFEEQCKQTTEARAQASELKSKAEEQSTLLEERKKSGVELELELLGLRKALESATTEYESEIDSLRAQVKTFKSQAETAQAEATKLSQSLSQATQSRDFAAKAERERLETWSTQLTVRESQLRNYSTALTKEKSEVLQFSKQIAAEIEMISRTHPLRDYLKVTEFELSKVEVQLKTMPTLAPERKRLEAAINQLVEQREFLRSILAGAEKHFEQQVKNLEKLHQVAKMAPVPPPPPAKVEAAPSARVATQKAPLEDVRVQWESPVKDLE
jgi:chromosome segregation ATPase